MKRFLFILSASVMVLMSAISCNPVDDLSFEESDLYGKWQSGTLFYTYASDHTGTTWDTADDVNEDEAMNFTWELKQSELTHIYVTQTDRSSIEPMAAVPKVYTVITLTADKLVYEDDYGKTYSFSKVK